MNTKDVSKLLEESYTKLNLTPETVYEGKKYSIVDFCLEHLQMSNEDTIKFCQAHLSAFPTFTVKNEMLLEAGVLSKIGDGIRNAAQRITGNGVRPAPTNKPTALNVPAKMGNFFGTDTSVVRNSPMLKIVDPDMLTAKYLAFPKLDLTRPGHRRILQDIENIEAGKKNASGKPMQVSPVPDTERGAALASRSKVTVDTPMDDQNKQKEVATALDKLSALIQTTKKGLESGRAVSAEEVAALKGQVANAIGGFDAATKATDDPAKDAPIVAAAEKQIAAAAPAASATPTPAAAPKAPGIVSPTGSGIPIAAPAGTPPPTGLAGAMKAQYAAGIGTTSTTAPTVAPTPGTPASTPAAISPTPAAATSNPAPTTAPTTAPTVAPTPVPLGVANNGNPIQGTLEPPEPTDPNAQGVMNNGEPTRRISASPALPGGVYTTSFGTPKPGQPATGQTEFKGSANFNELPQGVSGPEQAYSVPNPNMSQVAPELGGTGAFPGGAAVKSTFNAGGGTNANQYGPAAASGNANITNQEISAPDKTAFNQSDPTKNLPPISQIKPEPSNIKNKPWNDPQLVSNALSASQGQANEPGVQNNGEPTRVSRVRKPTPPREPVPPPAP